MTYNPVTGEDYSQEEARAAWSESMRRTAPAWQLSGEPGAWWWRYFNFRPWFGRVTVESDGLHWSTHHDYDGAVIHQGVTTSIYEAYQSVVQNRPVTRSEVTS